MGEHSSSTNKAASPPLTLGLKPEDFDKIVSCLKLTTSDKEGEVIGAINAVNRILKRCDTTWDKMFDALGRFAIEIAMLELKKQGQASEPTIEQALAAVLKTSSGSFRDMILDYQRQWISRHSLSDLQRDTLLNAYHRANPHLSRGRRRY